MTQLVKIYMANDYDLYSRLLEYAEEHDPHDMFRPYMTIAADLERIVCDFAEDQLERNVGLAQDMLTWAFSEVDWDKLAEEFIEEMWEEDNEG